MEEPTVGLSLVRVDWPAVVEPDDIVASYAVGWTAAYRVAWLCRNWPRRLGGDATPEELAADKKLANKIGHLAMLQANAWTPVGELSSPSSWGDLEDEAEWEPAERRAAAVVDWFEWLPAQAHLLIVDREAVSEWCAKNHGTRLLPKTARTFAEVIRGCGVVLSYMSSHTADEGRKQVCLSAMTAIDACKRGG